MHIKVKDLNSGVWLTVTGRHATFVDFAGDNSVAEVMFAGEQAGFITPVKDLRPVFINRSIIERCGFTRTGEVYRDEVFEITLGDANNIYKITGRRLKKPFAVHLLSQLHIFQNIYHTETGRQLVFNP